MGRLNWKALNNLVLDFFIQKDLDDFDYYITVRSTNILDDYVGHLFFVHNGKTFISVEVLPEMVGHSFGEFVLTKRLGGKIHESKSKKKGKGRGRGKVMGKGGVLKLKSQKKLKNKK